MFNAITSIQNFIQIHQLVQDLHLQKFEVHHFGMVEAMALNSMESKSSLVSSHPFKISSKSTSLFKSYLGVSLHPLQKFKRPPFQNG
jgi:hypothetical protein